MEGKVNYTVVGVFVVSLSLTLLLSILWLSSLTHGRSDRTYAVLIYEDVTGLATDSPVRFNGVRVGFVESINLDKHNPKLVRLILKIHPDVLITKSTYAILNEQGLTGVVNVNLKAQTESSVPLIAAPGEPYPIIPSKPSLLMQLSNTLPELATTVQELSGSISQVLDPKNRKALSDSLQNIQEITYVMANNAVEFSDIMQNLDKTMQTVSDASDQFPDVMHKFNKALVSINQMSMQGRVAINNFSNQVVPTAEKALTNFSNVSSSVNAVATELQQNPSMLVRGREPLPPGPGER